MSDSNTKILPAVTAGINPENFADNSFFIFNKTVLAICLSLLILLGFGLRTWNLGTESFGEDELNKLQTVAEYRNNGISGKNGEHPFLMKGLQTVSIIVFEKINHTFVSAQFSDEFALRFPTALFGSFTALLLFFLVKELFGSTIGFISAALWAVDPNAIGFDRIAKEDSFLLFFFLLGNIFWLRSQTLSETGKKNPTPYIFGTAIAFGAMLASKYLPHILGIFGSYYNIFQAIPATKWRMGKLKWLGFFVVMGIAFIIFNPTILLPDTWREMLIFSGEKRIGHDAYEFFGTLYQNKVTTWLYGVPWYFYYVFIAVKTPLLTLVFFAFGLWATLKKQFGDGRYFLLFWAFFWFMPFTVLGGKFTRYFTFAQPIIFIVAAIGFYYLLQIATKNRLTRILAFSVLITTSFFSSATIAPHYRLFTNNIGNGNHYFPHDEFYDLSSRDIVKQIAKYAQNGATIASETPYLIKYYAEKENRADLQSVSLSDKEKIRNLKVGDFILVAKGRRYFSNDSYLNYLKSKKPIAKIALGIGTKSADIYFLDETLLQEIKTISY